MINDVENKKLKEENENLKLKIKKELIPKKEVNSFIIKELVNMRIIKPISDPFFATKNLFKNFSKLDKAINNYKQEIKRLQKSKNKIDSPKFITSKVELDFDTPMNNLDIINNRIIDLHQSIEKIEQFKKSVLNLVEELSEQEKKIINLFYFEHNSMPEIAEKLNYDQSTCYRKLDDALNNMKIVLFPGLFIDSMLN